MLFIWIIVFIVSLFFLLKGADWLIISAEKIGFSLGLSPFIIGITIVAVGTSLPELVSSLVATLEGFTDIVVANAIGSNIANILLIGGISAVLSRKIMVTKNLINFDLIVLAVSTLFLLGIIWDKQVTLIEAIILIAIYIIYILFSIFHKDTIEEKRGEDEENLIPKIQTRDFFILIVGIVSLVFGAKYLIEALVNLSIIFKIGTGLIAITAVAVGTSLPELIVSVKAIFQKKSEVALGNIFGSNIFNALIVVGLPGLFRNLSVDDQTFSVGIPALILATFLFIISGVSKKIYLWGGIIYLFIYAVFMAKLFNLF